MSGKLKIGPKVEIEIDETPAIIAAATIVRMSEQMEKLLNSGLNRQAIVVLLQNSCPGMGKKQIGEVLSGLENMRRDYVSEEALTK